MFRASLVILLLATAAWATDLVIQKTFVPDACSAKSKNGDHLYMHYSGYIADSSASGTPGQKVKFRLVDNVFFLLSLLYFCPSSSLTRPLIEEDLSTSHWVAGE